MEKEKIKKELIDLLEPLNLDSETMEDVLEGLGLRERLIHQILESEKYLIAEKVWHDFHNNDTLVYDKFSDYYHDRFLK